MSTEQLLLIAGAALLVFWTLGAYNRLQSLRNLIIDAWAQFDAPLQRRSQALAALLQQLQAEAAGGAGEADTLAALAQAQAQLKDAADALRRRPASAPLATALASAEAALASPLARLLLQLEQQPLPAAGEPLAVLSDAAERMGFARQVFNDAVRGYNRALRQFPTRLLSGLFGFGIAGPI